MNLSALLPLDALTMVNRVAAQVTDGLGAEAAAVGLGHLPPEDVLARAIVNWVKPLLGTGASSSERVEVLTARPRSAPPTICDLAAALGACECWGERLGCRICNGRGSAGWTDIDRPLFALYVQPALRRLRREMGTAHVHARNTTELGNGFDWRNRSQ